MFISLYILKTESPDCLTHLCTGPIEPDAARKQLSRLRYNTITREKLRQETAAAMQTTSSALSSGRTPYKHSNAAQSMSDGRRTRGSSKK